MREAVTYVTSVTEPPCTSCTPGRRSEAVAAATTRFGDSLRYTLTAAFRCAVLALALVLGGRLPAVAAVSWYDDIDRARAMAKRADQPMLLEFWADWCAPCRVMESEVYSKADVAQAMTSFVAVRINFDKKPTLARKYLVANLPTIVFTDSNGAVLFRQTGIIGAKAFTDLLNALPHDVSTYNRLSGLLEHNGRDLDALEGLGRQARVAGLYLASNDFYQRAIRISNIEVTRKAAILEEMAANYLDVKDGKRASTILDACLKDFPHHPHKEEWISMLVRARAASGPSR